MKYEEALEVVRIAFKAFSVTHGDLHTEDEKAEFMRRVVERHDIKCMIDAIEKQIPKKYEVGILGSMVCPVCGDYVEYPTDLYCKRCGQAIDWSEEIE